MQALEVSHLGRVTRLDQRFEACFDQLNRTTAQHGLLAEQIGLGLFAEVGLDDAGTTAAIGHRIRQRDIARHARFVLIHGYQMRNAATLSVGRANRVARCLWRDHNHVQISARHNLAVVHIEAVSEGQHSALLGVRFDIFFVHLRDVLIGQKNHDHVSGLHCIIYLGDLQASFLNLGP